MWTTLAFVTAMSLAPAQGGQLTLTNDRITYGGYVGATRPNNKFLPGDMFYLSFDIENVKVDNNGEVLYSMGMEVVDSKGKTIFGKKPEDLKAVNTLGGTRVPAVANVFCGFDQQPGEYTVKLTVKDRVAKTEKTIEKKFEIQKLEFGIVQPWLSFDRDGQILAPAVNVASQWVHVNFGIVGFDRDKTKKQPSVGVEMRVLDENGKPVLTKPFIGEAPKEVQADVKLLPMQLLLALNRPGKFTIELEATDRNSKKTAKLVYPIQVLEAK